MDVEKCECGPWTTVVCVHIVQSANVPGRTMHTIIIHASVGNEELNRK